jgi:hypothetical protein
MRSIHVSHAGARRATRLLARLLGLNENEEEEKEPAIR